VLAQAVSVAAAEVVEEQALVVPAVSAAEVVEEQVLVAPAVSVAVVVEEQALVVPAVSVALVAEEQAFVVLVVADLVSEAVDRVVAVDHAAVDYDYLDCRDDHLQGD